MRKAILGVLAVVFVLSAWVYFPFRPHTVLQWVWMITEVVVPVTTLALAVWIWRRGKRGLAAALVAVLLVVEGNFSLLSYSLGLKDLFPIYQYVSSDGRFTGDDCLKTPYCSWSSVQQSFAEYAEDHPGVQLLRREPIRIWQFWNWFEYATHPRWELDYAGPSPQLSP